MDLLIFLCVCLVFTEVLNAQACTIPGEFRQIREQFVIHTQAGSRQYKLVTFENNTLNYYDEGGTALGSAVCNHVLTDSRTLYMVAGRLCLSFVVMDNRSAIYMTQSTTNTQLSARACRNSARRSLLGTIAPKVSDVWQPPSCPFDDAVYQVTRDDEVGDNEGNCAENLGSRFTVKGSNFVMYTSCCGSSGLGRRISDNPRFICGDSISGIRSVMLLYQHRGLVYDTLYCATYNVSADRKVIDMAIFVKDETMGDNMEALCQRDVSASSSELKHVKLKLTEITRWREEHGCHESLDKIYGERDGATVILMYILVPMVSAGLCGTMGYIFGVKVKKDKLRQSYMEQMHTTEESTSVSRQGPNSVRYLSKTGRRYGAFGEWVPWWYTKRTCPSITYDRITGRPDIVVSGRPGKNQKVDANFGDGHIELRGFSKIRVNGQIYRRDPRKMSIVRWSGTTASFD